MLTDIKVDFIVVNKKTLSRSFDIFREFIGVHSEVTEFIEMIVFNTVV